MDLFARLEKGVRRLSFIDKRLRRQLPLPLTINGVIYRFLSKDDSIEELTSLINSAYTVFKKEGLNYKGVSQNSSDTLKRLRHSYTIVALADNRIIGTISYKPHWECRGTDWYNRKKVAKFNQLAVAPEFQKTGIGGKLLGIVETIAFRQGAMDLALDTSEDAHSLISYYKKRSYRFIGFHRWKFANYRSVILSKNLEEGSK